MTEVPGYFLGDVLGAGAGGTVHRAVATTDHPDGPDTGDRVAIKVISADVLQSRTGLSRWRAEARAAARVDHPGVVRVHDTGTDDESAWIVMEELSGPDLRSLFAGPDRPSADQAVDLVLGIADAVSAVHEAGLVHRDLKPANIVLHEGRPTLVDFGLARAGGGVDPAGSLTASHETSWAHTAGSATGGPGTAGTYAWMAPEQWRGEDATPATDVYALGGLLFTALTGRPPYPKETLTELAYSVALDDAPRPSDAGADDRFDAIVARAMAKEPTDRYPDAGAFRDALRAVAAGETLPAVTAPGPAGRPDGAPMRRRSVVLAVAASVVTVAAVGGVAFVLVSGDDADEGPSGSTITVCAKRDASMRDEPASKVTTTMIPHGTELRAEDDERNDSAWVRAVTDDGVEGYVLREFVNDHC